MNGDKQQAILNEKIRAKQVILILEDGKKHGAVMTFEALQIASSRKLDLLQVTKDSIPICKLIDYGKFLYEKKKKDKLNLAHHRHHEAKEIIISPNIGEHDLEIKHKKIYEFLAKGFRVLYKMRLEGREKVMANLAFERFSDTLKKFEEVAVWDKIQRGMDGKKVIFSTTLRPENKRKEGAENNTPSTEAQA